MQPNGQPEPAATRMRATILNRRGIDLAAATQMVRCVEQYRARILLERHGREAEADSLLDVTELRIPQGAVVMFSGQGPQAGPALDALQALIARRFDLEPNEDEA